MADEARRARKVEALVRSMLDLAGGQEYTSMFPGAVVVDDSYDAGPPLRILVSGRSGTYEPALALNGISYSDGDSVILLYVKGTEPIALAQAPGSGVSGDGDTDILEVQVFS